MNGSQTHFILDHLTTAEGLGWKLYDFPTYSTIIMLDYTYEKVYRIKILKQWSAVRNKNRIKAHVNVLMWWLCLLRTTWMKSTDCEWITDHTLGTPYRNRSLSPTRLSLSPCFSLPLNHTTRRSLIKCVYFFTLVFSKDIELCVCVCVCARARVCVHCDSNAWFFQFPASSSSSSSSLKNHMQWYFCSASSINNRLCGLWTSILLISYCEIKNFCLFPTPGCHKITSPSSKDSERNPQLLF